LFIGAVAVGHYLFGVSLYDADTDQPMSPTKIALGTGAVLGGFGLFAAMGFAIVGRRREN
jgi:hypothetical protein